MRLQLCTGLVLLMGSMLANVSFNIFAPSASKKKGGEKKKKANLRFLGLMYVT